MDNIIEVSMGSVKVAEAPATLTTGGIGSCIALCIFHASSRNGAMAHIMLPARTPAPEGAQITEQDLRFADVAIRVILDEFASRGVPAQALIAKLVGGASMFPEVQGRSVRVGEKNIASVKGCLEQAGVKVVAEDTGGTVGRAASFDLSNGVVQVRTSL